MATDVKAVGSLLVSNGLTPFTLVDGFPYLVIEYFKSDLIGRPTDVELRISTPTEEVLPIKAVEGITDIEEDDNRVYKFRWRFVHTIVVIPATIVQTYFSESMNHPHYTVHPLEYKSYCSYLKSFQDGNDGYPILYFCDRNQNHTLTGMITVTNILPNTTSEVLNSFDLPAIMDAINTHGSGDIKRGNQKLDTGLASGRCQVRRKKWYGVAGPNILKGTQDPVIKQMRQQLYKLLFVGVPSEWVGRVYYDPERQSLFEVDSDCHWRKGTQIHACRAATSTTFSRLCIHRDSHNDNADPCFAPVMVASWLLLIDNLPTRIALITYSRRSVSETMKKIKKYKPAIEQISNFYGKMKDAGRHCIYQGIFLQEYKTMGNCDLTAVRLPPNCDTCLHWSSMGADALLQINRKYRPSYQQGLALLLSVCASNSPDYFRVITNRILGNEDFGKSYFKKEPVQIAIEVYEMIFGFKKESTRRGQKLLGQRHQPCGNIQASRTDIELSLQNLIKVCDEVTAWNKKRSLGRNKDVRDSYNVVLSTFCNGTLEGGIYGAGPLIANKLIQVGALVGLFPFQYLMQSKIAVSTRTFGYLSSVFNLHDVDTDSPILLDAIAAMTDTNVRIAEGTCCKAAQAWSAQKKGIPSRSSDTLYPEMSILTTQLQSSGRLRTLVIEETTASKVAEVHPSDLCWSSNGTTVVTLWSQQQSYWMGTRQPVKTARKDCQETVETKTSTDENIVARGMNMGNTCPVVSAGNNKRKRITKTKSTQKSSPRGGTISKTRHNDFKGVVFRLPTQAEVLLTFLECRRPFNKWKLLAQALGRHRSSSASKKDIHLQQLTNDMFVPSILFNKNVYYPPIPSSTWKESKFEVTDAGRVSFPNPRVARMYTILKFLQENYFLGLQKYFSELLKSNGFAFVSQYYKPGSRNRDPLKMIVFYDNDTQRAIEPMAVCLLLRNNVGVFALVDDFGAAIQDESFFFNIT
jgi:hypothetical protein